jgi:hypothetical protein
MGDEMPQLLGLICIRCGDAHQRFVGDPYTPELCGTCFSKGLDILLHEDGTQDERGRRYDRWRARWERHDVGHPTTRKLAEAWEQYATGYGPTSIINPPF